MSIDAANWLTYDHKFEEALAAYEKIIEKSPSDERARCGAVLALLALDRAEEAVAHIDALIRLVPDESYPHGAMGAVMGMAGRRQDALACYDRMLRIDPVHIHARVKKAFMLHYAGREKESVECINELRAAGPLGGALEALADHLDRVMDRIKAGREVEAEYGAPGLSEMRDVLFDDRRAETARMFVSGPAGSG